MDKTKIYSIANLCLLSLTILQCNEGSNKTKLPDGLLKPLDEYTQENAREWQSEADSHKITIRESRAKGKVTVFVELPYFKGSSNHYIESMGIYDKNKKILSSKKLSRLISPVNYAHFEKDLLPTGAKLKAYARCNLHDIWVQEIIIE